MNVVIDELFAAGKMLFNFRGKITIIIFVVILAVTMMTVSTDIGLVVVVVDKFPRKNVWWHVESRSELVVTSQKLMSFFWAFSRYYWDTAEKKVRGFSVEKSRICEAKSTSTTIKGKNKTINPCC
jgi:hypothetical protein